MNNLPFCRYTVKSIVDLYPKGRLDICTNTEA